MNDTDTKANKKFNVLLGLSSSVSLSTSLLHLRFVFQHPYSLFSKICSPPSLVINNSLVENFELVISNDDNNSPKESKCFQQR